MYDTVYAPAFDRSLETSLAGAIPMLPSHRIVITEGNYLLLGDGGWERVRPLLDECWYLDPDDEVRRARLVQRNLGHGRSQADAEDWVARVDEPNARLVATTRGRADRVLRAVGGELSP